MSRKRKRDPLLLEVVANIGRGRITLGAIHHPSLHVHGYMEAGYIRINDRISTVDTLLHEVLHRIRPKWSEQTIRSRTAKMMRQLTMAEIDKLYEMVTTSAYRARRAAKIR